MLLPLRSPNEHLWNTYKCQALGTGWPAQTGTGTGPAIKSSQEGGKDTPSTMCHREVMTRRAMRRWRAREHTMREGLEESGRLPGRGGFGAEP